VWPRTPHRRFARGRPRRYRVARSWRRIDHARSVSQIAVHVKPRCGKSRSAGVWEFHHERGPDGCGGIGDGVVRRRRRPLRRGT
jgi:hypothetical protein